MTRDPDKVMKFVERQLASDPKIATSELYEQAKDVDPGVKELTLRQFHARFPLQVKRRKARSGGRKRKTTSPRRTRRKRSTTSTKTKAKAKGGAEAPRRVREAFLRFAEELTRAEERQDLVKVLAGVDGYVDEVIEATGG